MKNDERGIEAIPCHIPLDGTRVRIIKQGADLTARLQSFDLNVSDAFRAEVSCHLVSLTHSISSERLKARPTAIFTMRHHGRAPGFPSGHYGARLGRVPYREAQTNRRRIIKMTIHSDLSLCNPEFAARCTRLHKYLVDAHETGRTKTRFEVFETYRDPIRQRDMFAKGVSKAGPFQSAHQFGLAVDFVPFVSPDEAARLSKLTGERHFPGWNWHSSHDYSFLAASAKLFKLAVPITWDLCHVEHPNWQKLRESFRRWVE